MRDLFLLAVPLLVILARGHRLGAVRAPAAQSLHLKRQALINNRPSQRAPNLTSLDRLALGFATLFINPQRLARPAAILTLAMPFDFHKAMVCCYPRTRLAPLEVFDRLAPRTG